MAAEKEWSCIPRASIGSLEAEWRSGLPAQSLTASGVIEVIEPAVSHSHEFWLSREWLGREDRHSTSKPTCWERLALSSLILEFSAHLSSQSPKDLQCSLQKGQGMQAVSEGVTACRASGKDKDPADRT